MKVAIIGGGPAGLYAAILLKKQRPAADITVYERNRADDTFGFGVVAFIDGDIGAWALLLEQDCSVETCRSATDDRDFHGSLANSPGHENYFKPKIISGKSPSRPSRQKRLVSRP